MRPRQLGYAPPARSPDGEELVVVFDGPRFTCPSPNGAAVRHTTTHVALPPSRARYYPIVCQRSTDAPSFVTEVLDGADRPDDAIEVINRLARNYASNHDGGGQPGSTDATVEQFDRAFSAHPINPRGLTDADRLLAQGIEMAFERFRALYARWGGWRYYGRPDTTDPQGYRGPLLWTEEDCRFRLALELEREFPWQVHINPALVAATVADWDHAVDTRQFPDVLISDLRLFEPDGDALRRFASLQHTALIEVKYLRRRMQTRDVNSAVEQIAAEARRLHRHLHRGRCRYAACFVVDDDGAFTAAANALVWPPGVDLLLAAHPSTPAGAPLPAPLLRPVTTTPSAWRA